MVHFTGYRVYNPWHSFQGTVYMVQFAGYRVHGTVSRVPLVGRRRTSGPTAKDSHPLIVNSTVLYCISHCNVLHCIAHCTKQGTVYRELYYTLLYFTL